MKLIFDTNIIIEALRLNKKATDILRQFENKEDSLCISSISIFELFSGKSTKVKEKAKKIWDFMKYFEIVDIDFKIARRAGEIFRDCRPTIQVPDYIIAATALELNASVVTLNIKHFQKIPGLVIYKN